MTPREALQAALAGEQAAVHVYGVVGGRFPATARPREAQLLVAAYETHRARRDHLRQLVADEGAVPTPPAPGYAVDARTRDADALLAVARDTEERCAAVHAQLVSATAGDTRRWAVDALVDCAVRGLVLGGTPAAYPGAADLR